MTEPGPDERPREIENRSEPQPVLSVDYPRREIELVVMPYGETALVPHRGRMIQEVVEAGAFDGIERRARRVKAYFGHPPQDGHGGAEPIGRALSFAPRRPEGLVATIYCAETELGEKALRLADHDLVGGSAGFGVMAGGESWVGKGLRRLSRLFLDHIAVTSTPAYEGARVLAVRAEDAPALAPASPTPNIDAVRAWALERRLAEIEAGRPVA